MFEKPDESRFVTSQCDWWNPFKQKGSIYIQLFMDVALVYRQPAAGVGHREHSSEQNGKVRFGLVKLGLASPPSLTLSKIRKASLILSSLSVSVKIAAMAIRNSAKLIFPSPSPSQFRIRSWISSSDTSSPKLQEKSFALNFGFN